MTGPTPDGSARRTGVKAAAGALTVLVAALVAHGVLKSTPPPDPVTPPATPPVTAPYAATTIALDATHAARITRTDSGTVLVTVTGPHVSGDWPMTAESYPNVAIAWATDVDSAARVSSADVPPHELYHNSDGLRYQRVGGRDLVGIDIGPGWANLYQAAVSRSTLDSVTAAVRAASGLATP